MAAVKSALNVVIGKRSNLPNGRSNEVPNPPFSHNQTY